MDEAFFLIFVLYFKTSTFPIYHLFFQRIKLKYFEKTE